MPYVGNPLADAFSSREKQDLTGQSGTSFTLSHAVSHANDLSVYINHVRQEPTTAYSVNGTTLTTTGSVAATDDFYIIYDELAVQSISHPTDQALTATSGTFTSGLVGTTATFSGGVAGTTGTFSGALSAKGGAVFNEDSADVDFRVESNDQAYMLFVDAGNNRVGVNAATPLAKLQVEGTTDAELRITRTTANVSGAFNDQGSVLNLYNDIQFENGYDGNAAVGQILFTSNDSSTGQGIRAKIACNKLGYSHSESLSFYVSPGNSTSGQASATSNSNGKALEIAFNKNMYHRATRLDAEHSTFPNIHIGQKSSFGSFDAGSTYIVNNAYYNTGSSWVKKVTGASNYINMTTTGDWYFSYSASANAGANTSFTNRYLLNDNGGGIYLYSDGHGNGAITMYNNNIYLGANTGSGEVYATDAAGNHTLLSPHNFQYIPDGKSEDHAWAYLSEKTTPTTRKDANDKDEVDTDRKDGDSFNYVNVDMMKVVREVEKLTGTKLVYTGKDGKDDGSTVKDDIIADLIKRIEALESK